MIAVEAAMKVRCQTTLSRSVNVSCGLLYTQNDTHTSTVTLMHVPEIIISSNSSEVDASEM